jgi:outer membrane protein TolC
MTRTHTVYRLSSLLLGGLIAIFVAIGGCAVRDSDVALSELDHYKALAELTDYGGLEYDMSPHETFAVEQFEAPPLTIDDKSFDYWDLSPEDVVSIALANSKVLRDLGGAVMRVPDRVRTVHDPAIRETDPRFGVEAALSAFDAQLQTSSYMEMNDRAVNNRFLAGNENILVQEFFSQEARLTKRSATGAEFTALHTTEYDKNNISGNLFPKNWTTILEGEVRQPLLQGAGWRYNRVAGPFGVPGVVNGVVVARINTDISLAEFRIGLRELVSNVENAYWDLYFAYRDLDAKIAARDASLRTWRRIEAQKELPGGVSEKEAQAREQYYRFQEEVENALSGRLVEGTRSNNGSSGGTFRGVPGVLVAERRLRLLMGVSINDGRLIRPASDPPLARVLFNWDEIAAEASWQRPELERQRLTVKSRELQLLAAKNHLLPRLDAVGRYRWRGFGEDLIDPSRANKQRFDNAYQDLTTGDFQEWQVGLELNFPIGFRRAHAAVRNAQLQVSRDRAVLREQERQVIHDLSNAVADMARAYRIAMTAFNRREAARATRQMLEHREGLGAKIDLYVLLDAQRREADAEINYYRALIEYTLSIKNVHYEKGSLLDANSVFLSENLCCENLSAAPVVAAEEVLPTPGL